MSHSRPRVSDRPWPVQAVFRLFRASASLQLAVALIALCSGVLAWATFVEGRYGTPAVHFAIYDTPWFTLLNLLLALNVLCAAAIRFPWKRHQTGFVVTHAGILVLLSGCWLSQVRGIKAQLSIFEGKAGHIAYQATQHFQLKITPLQRSGTDAERKTELEEIEIPLVAGPFHWDQYEEMFWFPWRLPYRSRGVIYDQDRVTLEVLDYYHDSRRQAAFVKKASGQEQPRAKLRLTVDGQTEEFWLCGPSRPTQPDEQHVVQTVDRRVEIAMLPDEIELGFQLYLRRFERKLDPGSTMASHYASRVDLLERQDDEESTEQKPKRLQENILITLNAPVDFSDPKTGRSYRMFQSSFDGPWEPGSPEFDALVDPESPRDQLFLSRLTVNYDPGRGLKYAGSLLLIVGIGIMFYMRAYFFGKHGK